MQMARSTYYFELSKADQVAVRNHCLADEIKDIFSQHKGRYGVRRVYQELIKRGHKVNHKGKCYLSPILDMNTNEIISYDLSQSANMEQIQRMLAGAFTKFPSVDGLIFHSDQGWQYQHVYFRQALKDHKIIQSMSRKGNCYDNCIMETFFGRMKNEMFYGHEKEYSSFETFAKAVDGYINYYNNERIQEKTKWMPPTKFREASMCT